MQQLMTKELEKKFTAIGSQGDKDISQLVAIAHYFVGVCDWWMYEYNPQDKVFYGFVNLGDPEMAELGPVSLTEMEEYNKTAQFPIERDIYWEKTPIEEIMNKVKKVI